MSSESGVNIVNDGLQVCYDFQSPNGFAGVPTTNLLADTSLSVYNNVGNDVTASLTQTDQKYRGAYIWEQILTPITSNGVSWLTGQNNPGIGVVTGGGGGTGGRYTGHSIFFKPDTTYGQVAMSGSPIYTHYSNIAGWQTCCNYDDMGDGWFRAWVIWYDSVTRSDGKYWAINPLQAYINRPIKILWAGPFKEDRNDSSFVSAFVNGTRSAGTGALDLTKNRTTSGLNVTYPSGYTYANYPYLNSYNGALTTDSSAVLNTDTHSIFFMIRFNTTSSYGSNGYSGSWDKIFGFEAGGSDRTPGIWRYPSERTLHWRYDPGNSGCDFGKSQAGSGDPFVIDTWYYVGVTKNGASTVMYVNGVQVGTGSVSNPKTSGNAAVQLFNYYPTSLASMGLCHIYNRVLTSTEVSQNFNAIRKRYNL